MKDVSEAGARRVLRGGKVSCLFSSFTLSPLGQEEDGHTHLCHMELMSHPWTLTTSPSLPTSQVFH